MDLTDNKITLSLIQYDALVSNQRGFFEVMDVLKHLYNNVLPAGSEEYIIVKTLLLQHDWLCDDDEEEEEE